MYEPLEAKRPEAYGFEKMFMNLDKSLRMLIFTDQNLKTNIEIYIDKLDKVEPVKQTKTVHMMHKVYKSIKKQSMNPDEYLNHLTNEKGSCFLFNEEYRYKCLSTPYYLVMLSLRSGIEIDVIFNSYKDYKDCTRGLECILNIKPKLALLKNRIII